MERRNTENYKQFVESPHKYNNLIQAHDAYTLT